MYRVCFTWILVVLASVCVAQANKIEQLIRQLDQKNAQVVAKADTVALLKLWAPEFTLNRTDGTIVSGRENSLELIKQGMVSYTSFSVKTETVVIKNAKLAVSMGSEVVVSAGTGNSKGETKEEVHQCMD